MLRETERPRNYNNVIFLNPSVDNKNYETVLRDNRSGRAAGIPSTDNRRAVEDLRTQPDADIQKAGDNAACDITVQTRAAWEKDKGDGRLL